MAWREALTAGRALPRDLAFGLRMLRRNPGFTLVAILTLALAIGANVAIFSVTSAMLLRPFPYRQPQQLLSLQYSNNEFGLTLLRYELLRDRARTFEIAAWANDNLNLTGAGEPVQVPVARVTPNFFSLLGVRPALGRGFTPDEGRPEGHQVVMLSNSLWHTRFNSNPAIVGSAILLDGPSCTVVGVLPAGMNFPFVGKADVWTPRYFELTLMPAARIRMGAGYLSYIGRLNPGATPASVDAELRVLNRQYRAENPTAPDSDTSRELVAVPLRDVVVGDVRAKLWILSAAVALLLLIGCANVASLLLSRALARRRELAIRAALGASRSAVIRQLLTESVLLASAAGILGVALGYAADSALVAWGSAQLPEGVAVTMDTRVLLFAIAISFATGILTGLFPALQLARTDLNTTLRDEGRGLSGSRSRARLRSVLVVGQVALSLLLLIGAGLLVRSFDRLLHVDPGFDAHSVLTMELSLPTEKYAKPDQQTAFFDEVLRRVAALPGVQHAAISAALPLSFVRQAPILPEGRPLIPLSERTFIVFEAVSPDWFRTLDVPLLSGRQFTDADDARAPKVVILNQASARLFWPGENPIGKRFILGRGPGLGEVVGVAANVRNSGLAADVQPQLWIPFKQLPWGNMNLLVRTSAAPTSLASAVRAQIAAVDPDQPVTGIQTVDDLMDAGRAQPRFTMVLLAAFSITALALAAIGLAATLAWTVVQRSQEMAIRLALGAERRDILWLVVRQGLTLSVGGIAIGLAAGFLLTRLMSSVLYRTSARDLSTFALAPLLFLGIAWLASWLPARRATRVDPIDTLRAS
jgi:putative ABC transport system permease protein